MTVTDPLATYRAARVDTGTHPAYTRRHDDNPTLVRQIVLEFLVARLEATKTRLEFLLDPTPENMTAWTNAEEKLIDTNNARTAQ